MADTDRFEARFEAWIQARADVASRPFDAAAIARSTVMEAGRQRRWWGILGGTGALRPTTSLVRTMLVGLVVALLAGAGLLVGSQLLKPSLIPAGRGVFTPTGSMADGREDATATTLRDGRVLVVGGYGPGTAVEVWDPVSGTYRPTGPLGHARWGHTATLLRDGRVLVVGGILESGLTAVSAEVWDPRTGVFSPTGSLATERYGATAQLLADGRVLVVGGSHDTYGNATALTAPEAWDPKTGTFSPADSLPEAQYPVGTLLEDGRVLVISGPSAMVWDPATRLSSPAGSLTEPRGDTFTATRLLDGRVLVVGGEGTEDRSCVSSPRPDGSCVVSKVIPHFRASAEIWDPATGSFSPTGSLRVGRSMHAAALLLDGRVLVIGNGYVGDSGSTAEQFQLR